CARSARARFTASSLFAAILNRPSKFVFCASAGRFVKAFEAGRAVFCCLDYVCRGRTCPRPVFWRITSGQRTCPCPYNFVCILNKVAEEMLKKRGDSDGRRLCAKSAPAERDEAPS